jgi:hypothetical protein
LTFLNSRIALFFVSAGFHARLERQATGLRSSVDAAKPAKVALL